LTPNKKCSPFYANTLILVSHYLDLSCLLYLLETELTYLEIEEVTIDASPGAEPGQNFSGSKNMLSKANLFEYVTKKIKIEWGQLPPTTSTRHSSMCLAIYENIVSHKKKCIYKKRQT
jgi:hypothetical protein